jgi:hypothetical protein
MCDGKEVGVYQAHASNNGKQLNVWRYKICVHTESHGQDIRTRHPTFPFVSGRFYKAVTFDEASSIWSFADSNFNLNLTLEEVFE